MQPTVKSLIRLHRCTCWPCSMLMTTLFTICVLIGHTNTCYCSHIVDWTVLTASLTIVILWSQHNWYTLSIIRFVTITLLCTVLSEKALHSLTGVRVISTVSVRIETAAIIFNAQFHFCDNLKVFHDLLVIQNIQYEVFNMYINYIGKEIP